MALYFYKWQYVGMTNYNLNSIIKQIGSLFLVPILALDPFYSSLPPLPPPRHIHTGACMVCAETLICIPLSNPVLKEKNCEATVHLQPMHGITEKLENLSVLRSFPTAMRETHEAQLEG